MSDSAMNDSPMDDEGRKAVYERTMEMLKPAFERVVADPAFRERLEATPLEALAEIGVELDDETRAAMEGRRFSEFWAARRKEIEGPVEIRDLPPGDAAEEEVSDQRLEAVVGGSGFRSLEGSTVSYAPPYVPVGPVIMGDNVGSPGHIATSKDDLDLKRE